MDKSYKIEVWKRVAERYIVTINAPNREMAELLAKDYVEENYEHLEKFTDITRFEVTKGFEIYDN